ncbi:hypothetical protein RFI_38785, partial [Reticulomyxa filosa]
MCKQIFEMPLDTDKYRVVVEDKKEKGKETKEKQTSENQMSEMAQKALVQNILRKGRNSCAPPKLGQKQLSSWTNAEIVCYFATVCGIRSGVVMKKVLQSNITGADLCRTFTIPALGKRLQIQDYDILTKLFEGASQLRYN